MIALVRVAATNLAALGFCIPTVAFAAGPPAKPAVVDVALRDGGILLGQVVDPQGKGIQGTTVALRHYDREVVKTSTGAEGYFAVKEVRGGVYQIASGDGIGVYRLWAPGTAPPSAQEGALLVANDTVVRGQQPNYIPPGAKFKTLLSNPLVIGGIVATAVAVPVAIHNSRSSSPASP
jgi:hypothetical protein